MIYPMMVAVDFASIRNIGRKPKGLIITLVVNWLIKPFTMAALAVLFFDYLYAGVIGEAMLAIVLANSVREKFGGDSMDEALRNFESYQNSLQSY